MESFSLSASDGTEVACYLWDNADATAVIQITHGMGEHARRYDDVAQQLVAAGYLVYAVDLRGHGITGEAKLGYMGPDGWNRCLADMFELNQLIRQRHPGLPLILLGHSMGSMLSQQYLTRYGRSIDALVLSGSPGFKAPSKNPLPGWILRFEIRRVGRAEPSSFMQKMVFGNANNAFASADATGFEWLSRDPQQVQSYVDDEFCGFVLATGSLLDMYVGSVLSQDVEALQKSVDQNLPIYIFSGSDDPVHSERQDILRMQTTFAEAGLQQITLKFYAGGRHEMFNETNRLEVLEDLKSWLQTTSAGLAAPSA